MNFVQLVGRLKRKCRVSGVAPTTLQNVQVEEVARLVDWVNEAWMDIQLRRPDWNWMRTSAPFTTVAGQAVYPLAQIGVADFGNWDEKTFRCYDTSAGLNSEMQMDQMGYDAWRNAYYIGALRQTQSRPMVMAVAPDLSICLGPVPAVGYTVTGDYFRVATELAADADTPVLPSQFHMAIIYRAMMYYGTSEAAPEVYDEGQMEFNKMMGRIALQQLPEIELGAALV